MITLFTRNYILHLQENCNISKLDKYRKGNGYMLFVIQSFRVKTKLQTTVQN